MFEEKVWFSVYLLIVVVIGYYGTKATRDPKDYFLGGNKLGPWVLSATTVASDQSGFLFTGMAGMYFLSGIPMVAGRAIAIAVYISLFFINAIPLRMAAKKFKSLTIPDYFETRFNDEKHHTIRWVLIFVLLLGTGLYLVSQWLAGGTAIASVFSIPLTYAIIIPALVTILYSTLGGFFAVSWTDTFQGAIMFFGVIILAFVSVSLAGGFTHAFEVLEGLEAQGQLKDGWLNMANNLPLLIGFLLMSLGTFGYPHVNVRFMAAGSPRTVYRMIPITVIMTATLYAGTAIAGIMGRAIYLDTAMINGGNPERIFITMFQQGLPTWASGIFIAAILAAVMSTASSLILVASSAVANDLFGKIIYPDMSLEKKLKVSRWSTFVIGIITMILAINPIDTIFWIASMAWTFLGTLGPATILSLWWKRTTKAGVLAGIIGGSIISVAWYMLGLHKIMHQTGPTIISGFIITWLVSLFTVAPPEDRNQIVDTIKNNYIRIDKPSTAVIIERHVNEKQRFKMIFEPVS